MADAMDQRRIFFSNLRLLGCDVRAYEAKYNIPFNKDMFNLPNKRGAEVVLYFLFHRLNPAICREEFRDCWPVMEKKQEAQFRKTCNSWLTNISKEEPDAHLPRIAASLFLAPGGEKFYQLLFHLSTYVLQKSLERDCGSKVKDLLRYPTLTQQNLSLAECIANTLPCGIIRKRKKYLNTLQQTVILNKEWKDYASELVKSHRKLSKEIRELEHRIRTEQQLASESGLARGSPISKRNQSLINASFSMDPRTIKRAQRVQKVQAMWKQIDDFCNTEAAEREVIESIVEQTMKKHKIDATEVSIKVPDLLLRECEEEIRRRHVDNTFHGGKLNLISVVQLWNLCLHLYIEKIQQVGVPDLEPDVDVVTKQVHSHHAYLAHVQSLRKQVKELLPELKRSVETLRTKIDYDSCKQSTPKAVRSTCVDLGFTEPTPPVSFTPQAQPSGHTPDGPMANIDVVDETTPEAAIRLAQSITDTVRKHSNVLFPELPVHTSSFQSDDNESNRMPKSKLPKPVSFTVGIENEKLKKNENKDIRSLCAEEERISSTVLNSSHSSHFSKSTVSQRSQSENSSLYQTPGKNGFNQLLTPRNDLTKSQTKAAHIRREKKSPSDIIADKVMNDSIRNGNNHVFSPRRDEEEFQHLRHHSLNESTSSLTDLIVDQVLRDSEDDKAEFTDAAFVTRNLLRRSPTSDPAQTPTHNKMLKTPDRSQRSNDCEDVPNEDDDQHLGLYHQNNTHTGFGIGNSSGESDQGAIETLQSGKFPRQKMDYIRSYISEDLEVYDYEEPMVMGEHNNDYEMLPNQNLNAEVRGQGISPADQAPGLNSSLDNTSLLELQKAQRSLLISPRQTPTSVTDYFNRSGQQIKTPTPRTPIEQEVRRMWHAALTEEEDLHTQSLPLQHAHGLQQSPKSDVYRSLTLGGDQLTFTKHATDKPYSESKNQSMFGLGRASNVEPSSNHLEFKLTNSPFPLDENLDDIEMPDLHLHESLEDFFSPTNKSERNEGVSMTSFSIDKVKFPTSDEHGTDIFSSTQFPDVKNKIYNDNGNSNVEEEIKQHWQASPVVAPKISNMDSAPRKEMSSAEERYWILKQQLQKEELKKPEDFTSIAEPLKFKLEDFDFLNSDDNVMEMDSVVPKTNKIVNSVTGCEKMPMVCPNSVLSDQENINIEEVDIDLLSSLDDSFAPLKSGLCLEGGTPVKKSPPKNVSTKTVLEEIEKDDLVTRFQKLKSAASVYLQK